MPKLTNQEVFAYALYRLQGVGQFVDVEDVYVECWRLSPSRFGWRRHQFPNYKIASKAQRDFEEQNPTLVVKTANGLGRQLTAEGVSWIRARLQDFQTLETGESKAPATRRGSHRLITQLAQSRHVAVFLEGKTPKLTTVELADMLSCAPDSHRSIWRQRMATLRSAAEASERSDLLRFLDSVESGYPELFQGIR